MANLKSSIRWQRYEPDLPGNRVVKGVTPDGHRPFYFEVAADLTKEQFRALQREMDKVEEFPEPPKDETAEAAEVRAAAEQVEMVRRAAAALSSYVRFGVEPLTLDGAVITTLDEYLVAALRYQTLEFFAEVSSVVTRVNSLGGIQGFFSERLSGGFGSTTTRRKG